MFKIIGADGKEYGPITADQLRQWISEGRVNGHTRAQAEGSADWRPLSEFPEFATLAAPPPSLTPPPFAPTPPGPEPLSDAIFERDYDLDIFGCIGRSWNLVSSNFGLLVGGVALFLVIQMAIGVFGFIPFIGAIVSLASLVVMGPMVGGLYYLFLRVIRGQPAEVGDIFAGFKSQFIHLMAVYLISLIVTGLLCIPGAIIMVLSIVQMVRAQGVEVSGVALAMLGFFLVLIPVLYITILWLFSLPLVIDRRMDFWPAMQASRAMVSKHWWKLFAFMIVCGLINIAGVFACYIGTFFTMPLVFGATMYTYEDIFSDRPNSFPAA